jgi:hypothetical protein
VVSKNQTILFVKQIQQYSVVRSETTELTREMLAIDLLFRGLWHWVSEYLRETDVRKTVKFPEKREKREK